MDLPHLGPGAMETLSAALAGASCNISHANFGVRPEKSPGQYRPYSKPSISVLISYQAGQNSDFKVKSGASDTAI